MLPQAETDGISTKLLAYDPLMLLVSYKTPHVNEHADRKIIVPQQICKPHLKRTQPSPIESISLDMNPKSFVKSEVLLGIVGKSAICDLV